MAPTISPVGQRGGVQGKRRPEPRTLLADAPATSIGQREAPTRHVLLMLAASLRLSPLQPSRLTVLRRVALRTLYSSSAARAGALAAAAGGGAGSGSSGGSGPAGSTATQPQPSASTGSGNGASVALAEEQHSHVFRKGARTVFEMPMIKDTIELTEEEAALFKELLDATRAVRSCAAYWDCIETAVILGHALAWSLARCTPCHMSVCACRVLTVLSQVCRLLCRAIPCYPASKSACRAVLC